MPISNTKKTLTMFQNAKGLLSDNGILIYRGGSVESISIPDLLKSAGFTFSMKKEIRETSKSYKENGALSIAANFDFKKISSNEVSCDDVARFYINRYGFLKPGSFSFTESRFRRFFDLDINPNSPTPLDKQALISDAIWNAKPICEFRPPR